MNLGGRDANNDMSMKLDEWLKIAIRKPSLRNLTIIPMKKMRKVDPVFLVGLLTYIVNPCRLNTYKGFLFVTDVFTDVSEPIPGSFPMP